MKALRAVLGGRFSIQLIVAFSATCLFSAGVRARADQTGVLWKDPGKIEALDLYWGSGSADRAPKGPFAFVEEDTGGTQPKIVVRDVDGREWDVKFGEEVHAEIASNRLAWALGYIAEELYYVPNGKVSGINTLKSVKRHIAADGTFESARFRLRDAAAERAKERWTFQKNPFLKSKELSGLAILMTLLNNWDILGERNNRILHVEGEDHYIVSDLGATFGKMGAFPVPRTKWTLADFQKEEFIEKVDNDMLDLDYEGYGGINKVPLDHARWFEALISRLTDDQLQAGLRASGATDAEVAGFAARLREKITELKQAVNAIHSSR